VPRSEETPIRDHARNRRRPDDGAAASDPMDGLTKRERDMLALEAEGHSNDRIAERPLRIARRRACRGRVGTRPERRPGSLRHRCLVQRAVGGNAEENGARAARDAVAVTADRLVGHERGRRRGGGWCSGTGP